VQTAVGVHDNLQQDASMKLAMRNVNLRNVFLVGVILFATSLSVSARSLNYFEDIKSKYQTFVVIRITSASAIELPSGQDCFFKYDANVVETIRGAVDEKQLTFFSEAGLTMGGNYLMYFSAVDARKYRINNEFNEQDNSFCQKNMTGLLFLNDEIHELEDRTVNGRFVRYIRFNDPWASFIEGHSKDETVHLIDFGYVRKSLAE
jgi:hypothetical protein